MDKLQQVKAKLEEMKVKYNFERENEDNPNHSDGFGMFYSGFFTCLKEISFFIDALEVKDVDLEKEIRLYKMRNPIIGHREESLKDYMSNVAKHFFELGLKAQKRELVITQEEMQYDFLNYQKNTFPKWSEEDDKILDKIVNSLMGAENVECADYNIMYDWLNSIEERMQ